MKSMILHQNDVIFHSFHSTSTEIKDPDVKFDSNKVVNLLKL